MPVTGSLGSRRPKPVWCSRSAYFGSQVTKISYERVSLLKRHRIECEVPIYHLVVAYREHVPLWGGQHRGYRSVSIISHYCCIAVATLLNGVMEQTHFSLTNLCRL